MTSFPAFRLDDDNGRLVGSTVDTTVDQLDAGDVVIRASHSSVNFKDALAGTGAPGIVRKTPVIGGIDVAGRVESSTDARFAPGDEVLVTGYGMGVTHDGGYASYVRVPGDWVVPRPTGLTAADAMALGTAGFTAALALLRLERNGLEPGRGPVVVTGATGGVGSIGIACLARRGYEVVAMTGKAAEHDYLRSLGAHDVIGRDAVQAAALPGQALSGKALEKARWTGAIDAVGGDTLAWLTRTTDYGGGIAVTGLAGGTALQTTVKPFILRGVSLLGIDSVMCPMPQRLEVWRRLATDLKPPLDLIARPLSFDALPDAFATLRRGEARGRFVVSLP